MRVLNLVFFGGVWLFFFFEELLRKLLQFLFRTRFWFLILFLDFSNVCERVLTGSCMCSFVGQSLSAIHHSELGYIFGGKKAEQEAKAVDMRGNKTI